MKNYGKALLGTAAAGALGMGALASPAQAQSTEEVIAGAVVLAGIVAILSSGDDDDRYYDDRYYDDRRYGDRRYGDRRYARGGNGRQAVDRCVRVAENQARRSGYRHADVYEINHAERRRDGWRIRGRIAVDGQRGYGNRYDRRRAHDQGRFTCTVEYGRVTGLDFNGVRGLR